MKAPCETIVWYLLPAMRAEIAKSLLDENLPQNYAAEKLGISRAAVCQYVKNKRGVETALDEESKKEIKIFAKQIADDDLSREDVNKGICILCHKLRENLIESKISGCPKYTDKKSKCE
jgi:predicted transcriptional regulator